MSRLPLTVLGPRHHPVIWGFGAVATSIVILGALDIDGRLQTVINTAAWLVLGAILGWHLKMLQQWPAGALVPRFLLTQLLGHVLLLAGLWGAWWLLMRPSLPASSLSLLAAGLGLCWPFMYSAIGLVGSVAVLIASVSTTIQTWFTAPLAWLGVLTLGLLGLSVTLVRATRAQQPATPKPLRWFWIGVLFNLDKPPKPVAESLARAMRVGAGKSWAIAGIILAVTVLISLIAFFQPETRPSLLAMLFPAWMAGLLTMPPLVHLNSIRSLDRLWLTGAFKTRRAFAQAVVRANLKHVRTMYITAMLVLIGVMFAEPGLGLDGLSLIFLLFGASVALLGLTVWTTQATARRLPIAITVGLATVVALLASYAMVVNDLLFEDPTTQLATFAGISVATQFLGVQWTGRMLSQQAPSAVSVARLRFMSD